MFKKQYVLVNEYHDNDISKVLNFMNDEEFGVNMSILINTFDPFWYKPWSMGLTWTTKVHC